ncbi:succinylglutamate desuccinylase [Larsenimonas rhizosphaerae]|uniref:Succinylglutamate desuccinylase n=1 Tax=Larsenimonas rhizosphaerae TaxID=2944682 RepID=A0AA41ZFC1_9GAMM|nr:succinylglutamate desuccinylase [Larsenimonas rhizosphaerae]MCX2523591.1 succinylglutamate desuccinylase [Larsenimonas rhizosphaerae]
MLEQLLDLVRREETPEIQQEITPAGTRFDYQEEGILRITPAADVPGARRLMLSAGIHGNETAPMELLDRLTRAIARDTIRPAGPILIVYGNPPAIRAQRRYIIRDINRLFNQPDAPAGDTEEHRRARIIETRTAEFFEQTPSALHIDMHTAIRESRIPTFALLPGDEETTPDPQLLAMLSHTEIEAVIQQHTPGVTFSSLSHFRHGARAVTLELGKARPFGQNQGVRVEALESLLTALIEHRQHAEKSPHALRLFDVTFEIIRTSDQFVLHVPNDQANFVAYPPNSCLAEDGAHRWMTDEHSRFLIFPNPGVDIGLRAGLVLCEAQEYRPAV